MAERIHLAANNPDLGGGEQMLLRTAAALISLDRPVSVVAPDTPSEVLDAAVEIGADVVAIRADGRRDYLRRLRAWDRPERRDVLWCHGLVPALATAGHGRRIVHVHQAPRTYAQARALTLARIGTLRTLTPSAFLSAKIPGSSVCANWTDDAARQPLSGSRRRVGFLGRLGTNKGLDLLADVLSAPDVDPDVRLVVAGDDRWIADVQRRAVSRSLGALGSRVDLLGRVSPEDFFAQVDLAVFPSRVPESFGLVTAEAMAAGIPFVISDAGALPEVAGPDHPWIARAGDADDLARVIANALAATPDEVRGVTDRARLRWEDQYSPRAGRLRVQRLLEDLGVG